MTGRSSDQLPDEGERRFHSRFGGLWIDQTNRSEVQHRINSIADPELRRQVADFERDGLVVLKQAVPHAAIDDYLVQYRVAARKAQLMLIAPPAITAEPYTEEKSLIPGTRVVDTSMILPAGSALSFAGPIVRFLFALFDHPALAFQSLHFEFGSTQPIHQDTAYVVVDREPLHMIASWIALEDVVPGTGELIYYVGGHRMTEYLYAGGRSKHFNLGRDGSDPHQEHLQYLHAEAARRGLVKSSFIAKKGDVLLWHADLPHGGSGITLKGVSRRSLVTHYCPADQTPYYFEFLPEASRRKIEAKSDAHYSSMYFAPERFAASASPADPLRHVWARTDHVGELLALDGEEFVYRAYVSVFNRLPDPAGFENYLSELKTGVSKLEVISRLLNSEEGRRSATAPSGYRSALLRSRLRAILGMDG